MTSSEVVTSRLGRAGLSLPIPADPVGAYVPAVRSGKYVFTSGQLPLLGGELHAFGCVGRDVDVQMAVECAQLCAVNAIAAATTVCGLGEILRVVKLTGYVAAAHSFTQHPLVVNGASDVMVVAFEEMGAHAREAVGVASLPMNAPVEVSAVFELRC